MNINIFKNRLTNFVKMSWNSTFEYDQEKGCYATKDFGTWDFIHNHTFPVDNATCQLHEKDRFVSYYWRCSMEEKALVYKSNYSILVYFYDDEEKFFSRLDEVYQEAQQLMEEIAR